MIEFVGEDKVGENSEKLIVVTRAGGFMGGSLGLRCLRGATKTFAPSISSRWKSGTSNLRKWKTFRWT